MLTSTDTLAVITPALADGQQATCWLSLSADGKFANTGSGNLSSYASGRDGTLNLEQAVAATADGAPIDSAVSSDGGFLFVDESQLGRILTYAIHGSSLMMAGAVSGLPTTVQGITAE